jgi:hypothetical protein
LSELSTDITEHDGSYDFQTAAPHHANMSMTHVIDNDLFWTLNTPSPFRGYEILAERLAQFDILVRKDDDDFVAKPQFVDAMDSLHAELASTNNFSQPALDSGLITFLTMNDGMDQFAKDTGLGQRIQDSIETWWASNRYVTNQTLSEGMLPNGTSIDHSIRSGNHANPIQIIGHTPAGGTDVIITGQNWGRKMQRHLTPDDTLRRLSDLSYSERKAELLSKDLDVAIDLLLQAGFSVKKKSDSKIRKPKSFTKDYWVSTSGEQQSLATSADNDAVDQPPMRP